MLKMSLKTLKTQHRNSNKLQSRNKVIILTQHIEVTAAIPHRIKIELLLLIIIELR